MSEYKRELGNVPGSDDEDPDTFESASGSGAGPSAHGEDSSRRETGEAAGDSSATQAATQGLGRDHFQLPNIDFSLPEGTSPSARADYGSPTADPTSDLDLPNFPQFDLPPMPEASAAERRLSDGTEVSGIEGAGGSFDVDIDLSSPNGAVRRRENDNSGSYEKWEVGKAVVPPPLPMPESRRGNPSAEALPQLPAIKTHETAKRDPKLLSRQADGDVKRASRGWLVVVSFLVVLGAGVVLALVYKDKLIQTVADPTRAVDDKLLEAQRSRTRARELWVEANALYLKKSYSDAIMRANEALELDPSFGKSHRLLALVYAETEQRDEAVSHYRSYLELEPNAEDATQVREIINDYEASKVGR